jgi:hypothetical protein
MHPFYNKEPANQQHYKGKREPVEVFLDKGAYSFALPAHQARHDKESCRAAYS